MAGRWQAVHRDPTVLARLKRHGEVDLPCSAGADAGEASAGGEGGEGRPSASADGDSGGEEGPAPPSEEEGAGAAGVGGDEESGAADEAEEEDWDAGGGSNGARAERPAGLPMETWEEVCPCGPPQDQARLLVAYNAQVRDLTLCAVLRDLTAPLRRSRATRRCPCPRRSSAACAAGRRSRRSRRRPQGSDVNQRVVRTKESEQRAARGRAAVFALFISNSPVHTRATLLDPGRPRDRPGRLAVLRSPFSPRSHLASISGPALHFRGPRSTFRAPSAAACARSPAAATRS